MAQGIERWYTPGPATTTQADRRAAIHLADLIRQKCRDFFAKNPSGKPEPLPDLEIDEITEQLSAQLTPDELAENLEKLDPDEAIEVMAVASRCVSYLAGILPRRTIDTPTGPERAQLGHSETILFRRQYEAVNDPLTVMADLCSGTITRAQSRGFAACYPAVMAMVRGELFEGLTDARAEGGEKWRLARWRQRALESFLDIAATHGALAAEYQAGFTHSEQKSAEQSAAQQTAPSLPDQTTPTQRIEAR
jgi:hypothetical protein